MNRRAAIRITLGAAAGLFLAATVFYLAPGRVKASAPANDKAADGISNDFTIRNEVRLVLLDVAVVDSKGNFVSGLEQNDFRIEENGRSQNITTFENQDVPVTMGILVDESVSMTPIREQVLAAADELVTESNRHDEVFVLNFNDTVRPGLPPGVLFSDQLPQLREALYRGRATGRTAIYDAVTDGLKQLKSGKQRVKTLVVISDGRDNISRHTRQETLDLVERSTATIFTVGLLAEPDDSGDADPGLLRRLAGISGGEALFPRTIKDVSAQCRRIAKDVRARYTLGYIPPDNTDPREDPLRHIHISVPGKPGLKVLARSSYRYEEAQ